MTDRWNRPQVSMQDLFTDGQWTQYLHANHALDPPPEQHQPTFTQAAQAQGPITPAVPMGVPPIAPERIVDIRAVIHVQALFGESHVVALTPEQIGDRILTVFLNANNPEGPHGPWLPEINHRIEVTGYVDPRMAPRREYQPDPEPERMPGVDPAAVAAMQAKMASDLATLQAEIEQLRIQAQIEQGISRGLRETLRELGARPTGPISGVRPPGGTSGIVVAREGQPGVDADSSGWPALRVADISAESPDYPGLNGPAGPLGEAVEAERGGVSTSPPGLPGVRDRDVRAIRLGDGPGDLPDDYDGQGQQRDRGESGGALDSGEPGVGGGDRGDAGDGLPRAGGRKRAARADAGADRP